MGRLDLPFDKKGMRFFISLVEAVVAYRAS